MQEKWVRSLDQKDPLEKEMATHSCILAWEISQTEEPGGLQSTQDHKELDTTQQVKQQHEDSKKTRHGQGFTEVGKGEQMEDFYAMRIFCMIL